MKPLRHWSIPYAILTILISSVYIPALRNGFAFDDLIHIVDNQHLQNGLGFLDFLKQPGFPGNLYRPATMATLWLQYTIHGLDPLPYHLFNLFCHIIVSFLVFQIGAFLLPRSSACVLAALFALHPLQVESVANVMGRSEILAGFFTLLTIRCALVSSISLPVILLSSFLAACSKESGVLVSPLLWIALKALPVDCKQRQSRLLATAMLGSILYLIVRFLILGSSSSAISFADNPLSALSPFSRALAALQLVALYQFKIIWPWPLSADYSFNQLGSFLENAVVQWLLAIGVAVQCIIACYLATRGHRGALLLLWFFVATSITSNVFFPIGTIFAERLMYLPIFGALSFVIYISQSLQVSVRSVLAIAALCASSLTTFSHSTVWANTAAIAQYQVAVSPASYKTWILSAWERLLEGDAHGAEMAARRSVSITGQNPEGFLVLGHALQKQSDIRGAKNAFEQAHRLNPHYLAALSALGRLAVNQKNREDLADVILKYQELAPKSPELFLFRLSLAVLEKDSEAALKIITEIKELKIKNHEIDALIISLFKT
jgi:tetratricopeptide (TPR) repeat protein